MSHTYDEKKFGSVVSSICERYFPVLAALVERLVSEA